MTNPLHDDEGSGTGMAAGALVVAGGGWVGGVGLAAAGWWNPAGLLAFFAAFFAVAMAVNAPGFLAVEVLFRQRSPAQAGAGCAAVGVALVLGVGLGVFAIGALGMAIASR